MTTPVTVRTLALLITTLLVLGQFMETQSYVPLPPLGQLVVAAVTVVGSFLLLHLPSVSGYVLGSPGDPPVMAPLPQTEPVTQPLPQTEPV